MTQPSPCPDCKSPDIGTDVLYREGIAMFCQKCGIRGPRTPLPEDEWLLKDEEVKSTLTWNEWAATKTQDDPLTTGVPV